MKGLLLIFLRLIFLHVLARLTFEFIWNFIKASIIGAMEIHIPKIRIRPHQTQALDIK